MLEHSFNWLRGQCPLHVIWSWILLKGKTCNEQFNIEFQDWSGFLQRNIWKSNSLWKNIHVVWRKEGKKEGMAYFPITGCVYLHECMCEILSVASSMLVQLLGRLSAWLVLGLGLCLDYKSLSKERNWSLQRQPGLLGQSNTPSD